MKKQRCLLLVDSAGEQASQEVRRSLSEEGLPFEVLHVGKESLVQPELLDLLSNQSIGTYLYILTSWELLEPLARYAEEAGFSDAEMECHGFGPRSKQVFCSACQKLNQVLQETRIICRYCGEALSVSDHYSKRLQAFLGYTSI